MSDSSRRVLIAMSGGVDSSVAAARLLDEGYEVIGITFHLWDNPVPGSARSRCCAPEDQHDARRVADLLGIAHYTFDRRDLFSQQVVGPFVESYLAGETPSPCVTCNRIVKMAELFALADKLGAAHVATGHYARAVASPLGGGRFELHRGRDRSKDQSYFLHMLTGAQLARMIFPLGEATKPEVRAEALRRRLPGASKGESQELCFVPEGRYDAFVEQRAEGRIRPGAIVDEQGRRLAEHGGIHRYTIGQRKGLGVALGIPAFVVGIDPARAEVRLGPAESLLHGGVRLAEPTLADGVELPMTAEVQVRYRHDPVPAMVAREDGAMVVRFTEPVRAIAKGQVAVLYDGDRVLGGGRIAEVLLQPGAEASGPLASARRAGRGEETSDET